ncbi:MAG: class I SAM-dependent methyltransferase [Patescibacteria group bacterium]|nr:class I SAM-dependent methyltransferase [Patescibacteria group bacterium]MDD5715428.1 class I SAM-dependent methyltransferase [Patescibacteria group bacterium]
MRRIQALLNKWRERLVGSYKIIGPNWKEFVHDHFSGEGIEIGALASPFPINSNTMMRYVDVASTEKLKEIYKPHKNVPNDKIIHVDYICNAQNLDTIPDNSLDFVCNSHLLEHLPDPGSAIQEWLRVVKKGGMVYIVVPDKRFTFDKNRQRTPLQHLQDDFNQKTTSVSRGHYEDFMVTVNEITDTFQCEGAYRGQASIHVHVWDYQSFMAFMQWLQRELSNFIILDSNLYEINIVLLLKKV